jgi:sugar phosphate isomerase/epimerase
MQWLIDKIQVNIPFTMLFASHLGRFIQHKINPEIGLSFDALEDYSVADYTNIAERLHKHGLNITLHAPFLDLSPGSPEPAVRSITRHRFEQMLGLVPIFKPKTVVCHTGYDWKRYWPMTETWLENSLEIWSWLGANVQAQGGQLVLENVYEHDPEVMRIIIERLEPQNVGFCLDIGHQAVFARCSLEQWIDVLGPFLRQVHLHDNCGDRDDHLALGNGNINFSKLFKLLSSRINERPIITLEPHKEQDLWPSLEYLRKIWPW